MDYISDFNLTGEQKKYINKIDDRIKTLMKPELYAHTTGTAIFAQRLAEKYLSKNYFELFISCLLHDYGKIYDYDELAEIAREEKIEITDFELNCRSLIHGFVGSYLVSRDFDIKDELILRAIKYHTIGYCDMGMMDKILFISDKIEDNRNYHNVEKFRELSFNDINRCLLEIYKNNIIYVLKKERYLHPETSKIWNNILGGI